MLSELCERIDAGEELSAALVSVFGDTKLALRDGVDRRIAFDVWIKGATEAARAARDEWDERVQKLKAMHESFKANTKEIVEANPGIPFEGSLGKIRVQKNPVAVETVFGDKQLTPQIIDMFAIEPEYVRVETKYSVDAAKVKDALQAGKALPWASIKNGTHVRFVK